MKWIWLALRSALEGQKLFITFATDSPLEEGTAHLLKPSLDRCQEPSWQSGPGGYAGHMNVTVQAASNLIRKVFCVVILSVCASGDLGAELVVSNVRAAQRVITKPEDAKLVDIWYDLRENGKGAATPTNVAVSISDDDGKTFVVPAMTFEGDFGSGQTAGKDKIITWDPGVDWDGKVCPNIRFLLTGPTPIDDDDDTGLGAGFNAAKSSNSFIQRSDEGDYNEAKAVTNGTYMIPPPGDGDGGDTTGNGITVPSALSNRTFVDTRDPKGKNLDALAGVPMLVDERPKNDRLISYEMTMQTLPRPSAGTVTVYSQIKIPNFAKKNGGWGVVPGGLGTFYGLEMTATASQFLHDDSIQYKVGGDPPTPNTPEIEWKPASFDTIIDTFIDSPHKEGGALAEGTYYFKIKLSSPGGGSYVDISAQFKSARLCSNKGEPVKALDSGAPLWLVIHGKSDGEKSFRSLNNAVYTGTGKEQVVSLDWASGAEGWTGELGNGRYFVNLGKNMAALVKKERRGGGKVNCIGHSWGTLVGYEIANAFGGFNRFVALDPALLAFGGYDDGQVNFGKISSFSTGVRGGFGMYGSTPKTLTCHLSIRLNSDNADGPPGFFHSLPRDWLARSMTNRSDAYWPFFKDKLLATTSRKMPWGEDYKDLSGFDLECAGTTSDRNALFVKHRFVNFNSSAGVLTKATIRKGKKGSEKNDWIYTPNL